MRHAYRDLPSYYHYPVFILYEEIYLLSHHLGSFYFSKSSIFSCCFNNIDCIVWLKEYMDTLYETLKIFHSLKLLVLGFSNLLECARCFVFHMFQNLLHILLNLSPFCFQSFQNARGCCGLKNKLRIRLHQWKQIFSIAK